MVSWYECQYIKGRYTGYPCVNLHMGQTLGYFVSDPPYRKKHAQGDVAMTFSPMAVVAPRERAGELVREARELHLRHQALDHRAELPARHALDAAALVRKFQGFSSRRQVRK